MFKKLNVDEPVGLAGDLFSVEPYVRGLTEFIEKCDTPMTIAIQGDWGTGKTSIMKMIEESIIKDKKSAALTLWFNTWQYSQFKQSDNLAISFLSFIVEKIFEEDNQKKNFERFKANLYKATMVGASLVNTLTSVNAEKIISDYLIDSKDIDKTISEMKDNFSEQITSLLDKKSNKNRVVIFIDDLDRLDPRVALELLEVLKIFLDVKNCVFVLAVDYEVVTQGIREKYGENVDAKKGKSFFDKLIQLPFKMPVQLYKLDKFVENQLKPHNIDEYHVYSDLIKRSIGSNPRSMKRLFNSFSLIKMINAIQKSERRSKYDDEYLFTVLCLQLSFEPLYDYLVENEEWIDPEEENYILTLGSDNEANSNLINIFRNQIDINEMSTKDVDRMVRFMDALLNILKSEANDMNVDDEISTFKDILLLSSITNNKELAIEKGTISDYWTMNYEKGTKRTIELFEKLNKRIVESYPKIKPYAKQNIISFKTVETKKTVVDVKIQKGMLKVYINLKKDELEEVPSYLDDVSMKGKHGSGDFLIDRVEDEDQFDDILAMIEASYSRKIVG